MAKILATIQFECPVLGPVSFAPGQYEVGVRMEGEWPLCYRLIYAKATCHCGEEHEILFEEN